MSSFLLTGYSRRNFVLTTEESSVDVAGQTPGFALVVVVVWLVAGLTTAFIMGKRGHDIRPLLGLGVAMGPLLVPYARVVARDANPDGYLEIRSSVSLTGGRQVVVVLTRRVEQSADLLTLIRQLEGPTTLLTLAVPAPLGAAEPGPDNMEPWFRRLIDGAVLFSEFSPRLVALRGRTDRALASLIHRETVDVVVLTGRCRRVPRGEVGPVVLSLER